MKTAVITGASSGLGTEFARAALRSFPDIEELWLIARRKDRLETISRELSGVSVRCIAADLSGSDGWNILRQELESCQPDIKLLINCAGVGKMDNIADSTMECQVNMVSLNVAGLTAVTSLALPYIRRGGKIINISSIAAFCPNTRMTVYSSTKAYVSSYSRGLGAELKHQGISVTAVCPGPMDTEFLEIAGIKSKMFDFLPHTDPGVVAKGAVAAAIKGKAVYTPGGFFKFYRVVAKIVPQRLMIHLTGT
jgi:uncharacterized protein